MAYLYSPPPPRERGPSIRTVGLVGFGLAGISLGLAVTGPLPGPGPLVPLLGGLLALADRVHRIHGLPLHWIALTFALGFDVGALVLPRLGP